MVARALKVDSNKVKPTPPGSRLDDWHEFQRWKQNQGKCGTPEQQNPPVIEEEPTQAVDENQYSTMRENRLRIDHNTVFLSLMSTSTCSSEERPSERKRKSSEQAAKSPVSAQVPIIQVVMPPYPPQCIADPSPKPAEDVLELNASHPPEPVTEMSAISTHSMQVQSVGPTTATEETQTQLDAGSTDPVNAQIPEILRLLPNGTQPIAFPFQQNIFLPAPQQPNIYPPVIPVQCTHRKTKCAEKCPTPAPASAPRQKILSIVMVKNQVDIKSTIFKSDIPTNSSAAASYAPDYVGRTDGKLPSKSQYPHYVYMHWNNDEPQTCSDNQSRRSCDHRHQHHHCHRHC